MKSNPVLYSWLKLNSQWRDALEKAEDYQNKIDVTIKHHLDGLGQRPPEEDFMEALNNWEIESNFRSKLQDFYTSQGLFTPPKGLIERNSTIN